MNIVSSILRAVQQFVSWLFRSLVQLFRWWLAKIQRPQQSNAETAAWVVGGLVVLCVACAVPSAWLLSLGAGGEISTPTRPAVAESPEDEEVGSTDTTRGGTGGGRVAMLPTEESTQFPTQSPTNTAAPTATETAEPTFTSTSTSTPPPTSTSTRRPTTTPTPRPEIEVVSSSANVRSGPGTDYDVVGVLTSGQTAIVLGRNQDGSWYNVRLADGTRAWIAADVVERVNFSSTAVILVAGTIPAPPVAVAPSNTPRPTEPVVAQPTATLPPVAAATSTSPPPAVAGPVIIVGVNKQAEYVDIRNTGTAEVNLGGWTLVSEKGNQACGLGGILPGGQTLRIWAMAEDSGQGGYNCGFGSNIWNNSEPDPAVLYDASGVEVSRWG